MEVIELFGYMISFLILVTSIWVYFDAASLGIRKGAVKQRFLDMNPGGWFISCLIAWIIVFPFYLSLRPKFKKFAAEEEAAPKKPTRR